MWSRLPILALLSGAGLMCGCSGTYPIPMPPLTSSQLNLAREEVQAQASEGPPWRHHVTDEEATTVLRSAVEKIGPAATQLCREMAVGQCRWTINGSQDRSLATAVGPNGLIVINRGIMEYANNEEEVAVVVAYGFAHHAANYFASRRNTQTAGSLIGTIVITAASVIIPPLGMATSLIQTAMESGMNFASGALVASYTKDQEREFDLAGGAYPLPGRGRSREGTRHACDDGAGPGRQGLRDDEHAAFGAGETGGVGRSGPADQGVERPTAAAQMTPRN